MCHGCGRDCADICICDARPVAHAAWTGLHDSSRSISFHYHSLQLTVHRIQHDNILQNRTQFGWLFSSDFVSFRSYRFETPERRFVKIDVVGVEFIYGVKTN